MTPTPRGHTDMEENPHSTITINDPANQLLSTHLAPVIQRISADRLASKDAVIPPTSNNRLSGIRGPRMLDRCKPTHVERADGSEPFSRGLPQLRSSPPTTFRQPEEDDSDIDDILDRYTTQRPSYPLTPLHRGGHTAARSRRHFTLSLDPSALSISEGLQRIARRQHLDLLTPVNKFSSRSRAHRKYSSVSALERSSAFSQTFQRHKRSSIIPLDEWAEAGTPLSGSSSQFYSDRLRGHPRQRGSSTPVPGRATHVQESVQPGPSMNKTSLDHMLQVQATQTASKTSLFFAKHAHMDTLPRGFAERRRSPSSNHSSTSSGFSYIEPSSSPERAIDILARIKGHRSADQEIPETEEENFGSSVSFTASDARSHTKIRRAEIENTKASAMLVLGGPSEILSLEPFDPEIQTVHGTPTAVPNQAPARSHPVLSLASIATVIDVQPIQPASKLSVTAAITIFKLPPIVPTESDPQPNVRASPHPRVPVKPNSKNGLTPVAIIKITSAWLLCSLARSIVRSIATAEPVQASRFVADLVFSMVLAVMTCVGFHTTFGGGFEGLWG